LALTLIPVPGEGAIGARLLDAPGHTLAAWVDRMTLDWSRWGLGNHIWESSVVYDPEGLLSTIPAIATTMIGVLVGRCLNAALSLGERLKKLFGAGAVLAISGLLWSIAFPINKNLWTSSYALFTAGVACMLLATISWLVDMRPWRRWTTPFVVFGMNPLMVYLGAELSAVLLDSTVKLRVDGRLRSAHELAYEHLLAPWLDPRLASLVYSLLLVTVWYFLLRGLYRRGVVLKI
jgi:predicted acyltransferase